MKDLLLFISILSLPLMSWSQDSTVLKLWPQAVPNESAAKQPPILQKGGKDGIDRITKVTDPSITVFRPKTVQSNHAAVLIAPGGGYSILAITHEGYEIAKWLNGLGYTAFVLQYRVPDNKEGALQDAQRALRMIRFQAAQWSLDSDKIGMLGFSAGGSLSARLSTHYDKKLYPPIDTIDSISARPDFTVLIYPAYLDQGEHHALTPELVLDSATTSPMFLFQTADDPYGNSSLVMASALREKRIPVELHLYPKGGHGYGLRENNEAGKIWPKLAEKWLEKVTTAAH